MTPWAMNRPASEPGWLEVPPGEQKKMWVKYVNNYAIIDRLRAKYPCLEFESRSSGGGREDLGILSRVNELSVSDDAEAFDRLPSMRALLRPTLQE
jgi:alpha-galactosidase